MSKITAVSLATGRAQRESFAQLGDLVVIVNGQDNNKVYSVRSAGVYDLGMSAPSSQSVSAGSAGNVSGTVRYRSRWYDAKTGTFSLPGAEAEITVDAKKVTVSRPSGYPARATHWVAERSTDGGRVFYPVNRSSALPYGSTIGTSSYSDNETDGTIRNRTAINSRQATLPVMPRFLFTNRGRIFAVGRMNHELELTLTNGSTAVTGGSRFTANQVYRDLAACRETTGLTFEIAAYVSPTALTLATAYTGVTTTSKVVVADRGDTIYWCEPFEAEHYGTLLANGTRSNQLTVGDDGEEVMSGCGLGTDGVLLCKRDRSFILGYARDPHPVTGDGALVTVPVRRGACGPNALRFINGYAYGIDSKGIWRFTPGSAVEFIGQPIVHEWRRANLINWARADYFHVGYDAARSEVHFFICENSDSYPKRSWIWSEESNCWIGSVAWPAGISCTLELPDMTGLNHMVAFQEVTGSAPAPAWHYGMGPTYGVPVANTPLTGTVTSGSSSTLVSTGASWGTSMPGVPVLLRRAADQSEETQIIISNTSTSLSTTAWVGAAPTSGDTYEIGPIPTRYRTGRLDFGDGSRKKVIKEIWIWAKFKNDCAPFKVKWFLDGNQTACSDTSTINEDGVSYTANVIGVSVDPTVKRHRFRIPIQNQPCTDFALEIYSTCAGVPWEINRLKIVWDWDPAERPPDK